MSIVTKTGDQGETGLFGGSRVSKNDPRVAAYGEVDELNSAIGVLIASGKLAADIVKGLTLIQKACFVIGSELATPAGAPEKLQSYLPVLSAQDLELVESQISAWEENLLVQQKFILPSGTPEAALCFWVRSVARRAERAIVALDRISPISPLTLKYLNRVSDYFFILGRFLNHQAGVKETEWQGGNR
ncbi:MAG: cob(I)yrinic acid a,c-diamide adenosyltransferase [Candidatus Komeilibacteria bacterium]|nr:cob(I)yrinic acid a,c-diamide adenosyltransferase [Candidatus Komeilibacteria bacterium]